MRAIVLLACGHWYREGRNDAIDVHPVDGEERACGHPEHRPRKFPAVYMAEIDLSPLGRDWARMPWPDDEGDVS